MSAGWPQRGEVITAFCIQNAVIGHLRTAFWMQNGVIGHSRTAFYMQNAVRSGMRLPGG